MIDTRRDSYGAGYAMGVTDERAGIVEPEHGYPDDALFLHGLRHGREDYRRRVESLCLSHDPPCNLVSFPRLIAEVLDTLDGDL